MNPILVREHFKYIEYVGKKMKPKPKMYRKYKNKGFFSIPNGNKLLIMSDIHSITPDVINDLIKKGNIDKNTIVISCGDMAGDGDVGGDGDPYESYVKIKDNSFVFYFVQGNHDLYNKKCETLQNDDKTFCHVGGRIQKTVLGTITGVNGVPIDKNRDKRSHKKSYKIDKETYFKRVVNSLKRESDIFLTHYPLSMDEINDMCENTPKWYLCGHYHEKEYFVITSLYSKINLDNKMMEFI